MSTLYRKYRPQTWEELVGQTHIKLTLQRELETNKLAHAYLFSGPRGSGKTTTARLLAKSLNCEQRQTDASEPCNVCGSCQEISGARSLDVVEIDAASNTGVDNVRENIIDSARLLPTKSKYKIFIIDEVHMLSASAFNALLKIIEEPPAHVFFILATTEPFKIPPTVLSRCQKFDFKKVEIEKIKERLKMICRREGVEVEIKVLDRIAHQGEGCLRDAESLLGQLLALGEKKITEKEADLILPRSDWHQLITLLDHILNKNTREGIVLINNLVEEGIDLFNFTEDLIRALRLLLLTKLNADLNLLSIELEEEIAKKMQTLSKKVSAPILCQMIEIFLKQKNNLRSSPIPQLPLEIALVQLNTAEIETTKESPAPNLNYAKTPKVTEKDSGKEEKKTLETNPGQSQTKMSAEADPPPSPNLQKVKEKWLFFIKKAQEYNHSLTFILKMGEPIELRGRVIQVNFKYSFHKDKINEPKMRLLAEKALNDVFTGANLSLEGVLSAASDLGETIDKPAENANNKLVATLLENFGGQIIE